MPHHFLFLTLSMALLGPTAQEATQTQEAVPGETAPTAPAGGWQRLKTATSASIAVETGTRIPLSMINSISTKNSAEGDRVYLETVFPILVDGRIVIPPGSYVAGTVTQVKRPGRIKGRGELFVRFDSLTLPNGVTRNFSAHVGDLDGRASEELDREEGKIKSEGNKSGDARTVGEGAAAGATVGSIAGAIGGRPVRGLGIGAAGGAAAGLVGVLLTRGPDAMLAKGTTVDMVLDRTIYFENTELNFGPMMYRPVNDGSGPLPSQKEQQRNRGFGRVF